MLELHQVTRRFGGLTALDNLTLALPAGARHALIGSNGAGKTTVVNLIAGTLRPHAGSVMLDGRSITRTGVTRRARLGIGRTWQHPAILRPLTAAENVTLALTPAGARLPIGRARRSQLRDRVAAVLDRVGLLAHADRTAGHLSYGQQRFLEIGVVLAAGPRLLLLDEPSAGLDPTDIDRLATLIAALPAEVAVLLVDHRLDLIWQVATAVTALDRGRHLASGTPVQIRANPAVQQTYLTGGVSPHSARPARPAGYPPLLHVDGLRADHAGAHVLHGVDLQVGAGEVVAVVGRNGTGKTTLLASIAGLHRTATADRLHLDGTTIPADPYQAARLGVASVPQTRRLFTALTVHEHLRTATAVARPASAGQGWTVDDIVTLFPRLRERLRHAAGQLSGGEQQMLTIARALLTNPRLLLLDEPTEGLAPAVIDALTTTIGVIAARGVGVLLAEQHLRLVAQVADRILVLDHGHVAMTAPAADLDTPAHRAQLDVLLGLQPAGSPT